MKLPKQTLSVLRQSSVQSFMGRLTNQNRTQVTPMTMGFSPGWDYYSWSKQGLVNVDNEQALILEMVRNSDDPKVKGYAQSNSGCDLYVRTGLHTSHTDPTDHVQVQLGTRAAPYASAACPAYTCHIRYDPARNWGYPTQCWPGIHTI